MARKRFVVMGRGVACAVIGVWLPMTGEILIVN